MSTRPWITLFVFTLICFFAPQPLGAQAKKTVAAIPGYEPKTIEGFSVLIHEEVTKNNPGDYKRSPLEVLELELKTLVKVLPPRAVTALRNVLIWVEWDLKQDLASGRKGGALAVYYGGHQLSMLQKGMHPLKANAVTILRMKGLTEEHQPDSLSNRCVILHEMTHAVHHQLFGFDNPTIKAAYKKAMEKKLYDKTMYASTNEAEYFAELSCAFFNQLNYFPRTRDELKKHDPATFALMENVWGKSKKTEVVQRPDSPYPLDMTMRDLVPGEAVVGKIPAPEECKGRAACVILWGSKDERSLSSLMKFNGWYAELNDFGLAALAIEVQKGSADEIKKAARTGGLAFPLAEQLTVRKSIKFELPHCFLFDHTGACVYRGPVFGMEATLRETVGRAVVAAVDKDSFSKSITPLVEGLEAGKPPSTIVSKLAPLQKSADADTAEEAKRLLDALTARAPALLEQAEAKGAQDPLAGYLAAERLPAVFKGTSFAADAEKLIGKWKSDKAVAVELKARVPLETIRKLESKLNASPGSFEPRRPQFQQANAPALGQMRALLAQMRKNWPSSHATEEAERIADRFGAK